MGICIKDSRNQATVNKTLNIIFLISLIQNILLFLSRSIRSELLSSFEPIFCIYPSRIPAKQLIYLQKISIYIPKLRRKKTGLFRKNQTSGTTSFYLVTYLSVTVLHLQKSVDTQNCILPIQCSRLNFPNMFRMFL